MGPQPTGCSPEEALATQANSSPLTGSQGGTHVTGVALAKSLQTLGEGEGLNSAPNTCLVWAPCTQAKIKAEV